MREIARQIFARFVILKTHLKNMNLNKIIKKRIRDVRLNPYIGKSEKDLDEYLKKRGVKIDKLEY